LAGFELLSIVANFYRNAFFSAASDESILKCCLAFLNCDDHFRTLWPWHELMAAATSDLTDESKWLMVECLGRVSNWCEKQREDIYRNLFSGQKNFDALSLSYFVEKGGHELPARPAAEWSVGGAVSRSVVVHGHRLIKDAASEGDEAEATGLKFVGVKSRESDLIKGSILQNSVSAEKFSDNFFHRVIDKIPSKKRRIFSVINLIIGVISLNSCIKQNIY
jgi:hypothetical protein